MGPYHEAFRGGELPKGFNGAFFLTRVEAESPLHGKTKDLLEGAAGAIAGLYNYRNYHGMGLRVISSADGQEGAVVWLRDNDPSQAHPIFTTNGVDMIVTDPAFIPGDVFRDGVGVFDHRDSLKQYQSDAPWVGAYLRGSGVHDGDTALSFVDKPALAEEIGHAIKRYPEPRVVTQRRKHF